jgi:hypothetical protein
MENRNGPVVQPFLTEANSRAERDAALLSHGPIRAVWTTLNEIVVEAIPSGKRVTLAGDKNYDTREFVGEAG